jgi:hypothetical protein
MSSHNAEILAHLKAGNTITQLDALQRFQCLRLGARVYDLKRDGHQIAAELVTLPNGKRVARYSMVRA